MCEEIVTMEDVKEKETVEEKLKSNHGKKLLQRSEAIDEEDLLEFIRETMNKSLKDRNIIYRIETDLIQFINDGRTSLPFPSMSSYHRMLVHRISTLFELDHNIDPIGNCVVVSKRTGESGKLLPFRFKEMLLQQPQQQQQRDNNVVDQPITIIQREQHQNVRSYTHQNLKMNHSNYVQGAKKKSYEERSEDYVRVRNRIFNTQQQSSLLKVSESFDESNNRMRKNIFFNKASSFGGYSNNNHFGETCSISPASSGYKSLQAQLSTNTSNSSSQDISTTQTTIEDNLTPRGNYCHGYTNNVVRQQQQGYYNQQLFPQQQPFPQQQQLLLQAHETPQLAQQSNMLMLNNNPHQIIYVPISNELLQQNNYNSQMLILPNQQQIIIPTNNPHQMQQLLIQQLPQQQPQPQQPPQQQNYVLLSPNLQSSPLVQQVNNQSIYQSNNNTSNTQFILPQQHYHQQQLLIQQLPQQQPQPPQQQNYYYYQQPWLRNQRSNNYYRRNNYRY